MLNTISLSRSNHVDKWLSAKSLEDQVALLEQAMAKRKEVKKQMDRKLKEFKKKRLELKLQKKKEKQADSKPKRKTKTFKKRKVHTQ